MIRSLTEQECEKLLHVPNQRYFSGRRNKLILMLMIDLGVRISEIIGHEKRTRPDGTTAGGIRIGDVDLNTGRIVFYDTKDTRAVSKRRKTIKAGRELWANDRLREALRRWYEIRMTIEPNGPDDLLFVTRHGMKISNRDFRRKVTQYADRAGIAIPVSPHKLRHAFASAQYSKSHDLRLLQDILGHSSVKVTEGYVHLMGDEVKKACEEFQKTKVNKGGRPKKNNAQNVLTKE